MTLNACRTTVLTLALAGMIAIPGVSNAQLPTLHPSFYGSGEVDTRNSQFYLLGIYVGMGGLGWSPYFNVNGWGLDFRTNAGITGPSPMTAISPTLGLAYASRYSGISVGAGYTWVHNPTPGVPGAEGGSSNGVTASFGAYKNGSRKRAMHSQLLANYNLDSRYIWARGRSSVPFGSSARHPARIGLEVVGQGGGKNGITSNTFQAGPTFEYAWTPNFRTTGVAGWKNVGGSSFTSRENAAYFKLEFSLSP